MGCLRTRLQLSIHHFLQVAAARRPRCILHYPSFPGAFEEVGWGQIVV